MAKKKSEAFLAFVKISKICRIYNKEEIPDAQNLIEARNHTVKNQRQRLFFLNFCDKLEFTNAEELQYLVMKLKGEQNPLKISLYNFFHPSHSRDLTFTLFHILSLMPLYYLQKECDCFVLTLSE
jgi:hypothetical protein